MKTDNSWRRLTTLLVPILAATATLYTGLITFRTDRASTDLRSMATISEIARVQADAKAALVESEEARRQLDDLRRSSKRGSGGADISRLEADVASLDRRMDALEQSLLTTPATALAVPMLRKDMDVLRDRIQASELAAKEQSHASDERTRWIFGLVAAALAGVMAQWFGARFKAALEKPKPPEVKQG